jgi:DNA (cytosine-5)-methyltransferase 1
MIKFKQDSPHKKLEIDLERRPSPTVMAGGIGDVFRGQYRVETAPGPGRRPTGRRKPPYRVPSMAEVRRLEGRSGLKVASTFSGCGGSSLGFRMAGFKVVWANEFADRPSETYAANMGRGTVLDRRDVRLVKPEDILEATGLKPGELDVLDGSPPCQAFSTAGPRHKRWGTKKSYDGHAGQQNEDLFFEFVRILKGVQPRMFDAENVMGLAMGVAKGFFLDILDQLKACGYRVQCRALDAQWLGVPQSRRRVFFVGVREDLGAEPLHPEPLPYFYSVGEACPWLAGRTIKCGNENWHQAPTNTFPRGSKRSSRRPAPGVQARGMYSSSIDAVTIEGIEDGYKGNTHSVRAPSQAIRAGRSLSMSPHGQKVHGRDPSPTILAALGGWSDIGPGQAPARPEPRKFEIREVVRICSFPDDFDLRGSYSEQWAQLGNSVPPLMARAVARRMREVLEGLK